MNPNSGCHEPSDWIPSPSRISPQGRSEHILGWRCRQRVLSVGTVHPHRNSGGWILYGMVRAAVGAAVRRRLQRSPDSFTELWTQQQREEVKYAAPAHGLCLHEYPEFPFPEVWFDTMPCLSYQQGAGPPIPHHPITPSPIITLPHP